MKVKELIKKLKRCNQDAPVCIGVEHDGRWVASEITNVYLAGDCYVSEEGDIEKSKYGYVLLLEGE